MVLTAHLSIKRRPGTVFRVSRIRAGFAASAIAYKHVKETYKINIVTKLKQLSSLLQLCTSNCTRKQEKHGLKIPESGHEPSVLAT